MLKREWVFPLFLAVLSFFVWFFYWRLLLPPFLTFSDAAKFAIKPEETYEKEGATAILLIRK